MRPYLASYDAAIFTREEFVPHDVPVEQIATIPPAIDPLSPKNMELSADQVWQLTRWLGLDLERPLVIQVSRFDPWKDPLGVIRAYRRVKRELPDLQLALVSVLERVGYAAGPEVTVRLLVGEDTVGIAIGPLDAAELDADLERQPEEGVPMRRLLETLVQHISVEEQDGGHWLRLEKRVALARGSTGEEA